MSRLEDAKTVGLPYTVEPDAPVRVADLEEFHERHAHDTYWARVTLMTLIFGMLALNLWMTQRNYAAMMVDVDASRMALSQINEQATTRLDALDARLAGMERRMAETAAVASAP